MPRAPIALTLVLFVVAMLAWPVAASPAEDAVDAVEQRLNEGGLAAALERLRSLAADEPSLLAEAESALVGLAERLLREGRTEEARGILALFVELVPEAVTSHRTLGKACLAGGDDEGAERHGRLFIGARALASFERIVAEQGDGLAETADEVIARAIEAMGGRDALSALRHLRVTSEGFQPSGGYGATRLLAAPHGVRMDRRGGRALVTDGRTVWQVRDGQWRETSNSMWLKLHDISLDLLDYEGKGLRYELLGLEALEGAALYKMKKTYSNGDEHLVYFDVATGLLSMEEDRLLTARSARVYADYREVAGVKLPHLRMRIDPALRVPHVARLSYVVDETPDPALFSPPTSGKSDQESSAP